MINFSPASDWEQKSDSPAIVVSPLQVKEVELKDFPNVLEIIDLWTNFAREQRNLVECAKKERFTDCVQVLHLMTSALKHPRCDEIFACRNDSGDVRGLMQIKEEGSFLEIVALVANPLHLGTGAGVSLLRKAEEIARSRGKKEIHLTSTLSATQFYHRYGYRIAIQGLILDEKGRYLDQKGLFADVDEQDLVKKLSA